MKVDSIDVRRAYFFAKAKREVYVDLIGEDHEPGMCGRLNFAARFSLACHSLTGCRRHSYAHDALGSENAKQKNVCVYVRGGRMTPRRKQKRCMCVCVREGGGRLRARCVTQDPHTHRPRRVTQIAPVWDSISAGVTQAAPVCDSSGPGV